MRDICGATGAIVYGRVPLMVTEKCVGKELADCNACHAGRVSLTDRRGAKFPVLEGSRHRSLIFNSVPVYMADRESALARADLSIRYFIFSDESEEQIRRVIRAHQKGAAPEGDVRRIKS